MKENTIYLDLIPEIITKDQLYKICHLSKSTALYLRESGKHRANTTARKHDAIKSKRKMLSNILKIKKFFVILFDTGRLI